MPFQSRSQERAAFGGYLGSEMKKKAKQWAAETPNQKSLPERKTKRKLKEASYHPSQGISIKG